MKKSPTTPIDVFKALADDARLRAIRALLSAELSVAELVQVLGLPQSSVSRHLKPLRDSGLLETRRDGTSIYYRRGPALLDTDLARVVEEALGRVSLAREDAAAVKKALEARRLRSHDFFERVAGRYEDLSQPGGGWSALAAGLAAGFAGRDVVDLGAGEGGLSLLLARVAASVTAVDQSNAMLVEIRTRAEAVGLAHRVNTCQADLEALPLPAASADAVFLSQSLHHAAQPERAVNEAARILRPGGTLILLDLAKHDQDWVRERWADQWLGFDEEEVTTWIEQAGLSVLRSDRIPAAAPEFSVLITIALKQQEKENADRKKQTKSKKSGFHRGRSGPRRLRP